MSEFIFDSNSFDKNFLSLLKKKKGKGIMSARFDLNDVSVEKRIDFLINNFFKRKHIISITYKILYWEVDARILEYINSYDRFFSVKHSKCYKNGIKPGIVFLDSFFFQKSFFANMILRHFNYEIVKEPALNLRVQVCVNYREDSVLLDIYDDRGFYAFYLKRK